MTQKEDLEWLLKLVGKILNEPENNWFRDKLTQLLLVNTNTYTASQKPAIESIDTNVAAIHKYLTLDVIPIINYNRVKDVKVQNQLYRDCLEMGKYRLGKINDQISFEEFCKYAHMQSEELINYYYLKKYQDLEEIKKAVTTYYKTEKIGDKKDIGEIPYTYKLKALVSQFKLPQDVSYCLEQIRNLRNYLSHRSSLDKISEDEILLNYKKLPKVLNYKDTSEENQKKIRTQNEARTIIFKRKSDWDLVYKSLNTLLEVITQQV